MNRLRSSPLITAMCGLAFVLIMRVPIEAAELRPYSPPVQQQAPPTDYNQPIYQQSQPRPKSTEPADPLNSYYRQFALDAVNLTQEQRDQLINVFSDQLDTARSSQQWDKVIHYSRLIDILSNL